MMIELKTLLCAAAGAAGGAAAWLLGGWYADIAVLIVFMAVGICRTLRLLRKDLKYITEVTVIVFCVLFLSFEHFYFGVYANNIGRMFQDGMEQAVEYAESLAGEDDTIYVGEGIFYTKILAFSKLTPEEYIETVQYTNYPAAFLDVSQCGN